MANPVNPIPIPAHIHYELLLQLLERQTLNAIPRESREQILSMIVMIRKAIATQKHLEEHLSEQGISVSYRWSLNEIEYANQITEPKSEPKLKL